MEIIEYYNNAKNHVLTHGYKEEVEWCAKRPPFEQLDEYTLFVEFVWVVLNSGMNEQIVRKSIFEPYMKGNLASPEKYIRHPLKLKAINEAIVKYQQWFKELKELKCDEDIIEFLDTLPHIGKVTKYHLARNIGVDCVKPDVHLSRLAEQFGFKSPLDMCVEIQRYTKEKLGVIDVILWRYCNLNGSKQKTNNNKGKEEMREQYGE